MATEQLTYAQIAERLGASVEAARAIVTRHHLPRSRSSDGKTLVSIDVTEIHHRRLPARSRSNHQADRPAAIKDQPVAEMQAVRALQEAAQVNERISTLEAELAAEQQRSASHLADYEQERDRADRLAATKNQLVGELQAVRALRVVAQVNERISTLEAELAAEQQRLASHLADYEQERARAGEFLSECISNGSYLLTRALRRVIMSAVQVVDHSGYASRISVTAGNRALRDVTLVVSQCWEVLRARCTNMDALLNKNIASTRLFFTLVGASAIYLFGPLRQIGRVAWFRFIFVMTSPIRLVARMLLSSFSMPHQSLGESCNHNTVLVGRRDVVPRLDIPRHPDQADCKMAIGSFHDFRFAARVNSTGAATSPRSDVRVPTLTSAFSIRPVTSPPTIRSARTPLR